MIVSFIVPVKNDAARLARCLASIGACPHEIEREIVVVDNGSSDDSVAVAQKAGARVLSIPYQRVAALRNAAASFARGQWLAFVDADHELGRSWLVSAIDVMQPSDVGAAGALYVPPQNGTWVQRTYGALRGRTQGRSETRWLGSGNLIVRRDVFEALGGFDPELESCEDVDFCQRLRQAGWKLMADERLLSVHHGDPSTLVRLFRAERWRGRDNLRVTFRARVTLRDIPSIVTPILIALSLPLFIAGLALAPFGFGTRGLGVALAAALLVALLFLLRALKISRSAGDWSLRGMAQALAVASTYELARGVALVTLAPHHRESSAPPAAPVSASTK